MGRSLFQRHKLTSRNDDLNQSILYLTEAILLPLRVSGEFGVDVIEIFSELAFAIIQRSKTSNELEDANFAIRCLRCLRGQPLGSFSSRALRHEVLESIIVELGIRVASGSTDGMQDINDVITIYDELLGSDHLESSSFRAPRALLLVIAHCGHGNRPILDQCIRLLRKASIRWPNSPVFSIALALSLYYRFDEMPTNDDFEEATTILNRIIDFPSTGNSLGLWQRLSLSILRSLAGTRATLYQKPEYVEEAISHFRSPLHHPLLPDNLEITEVLECMEDLRFNYLGVNKESTLQEALLLHPPRALGPSPSMRLDAARGDITESQLINSPPLPKETVDASIRGLRNSLSTILPGTPDYRQCLEMLLRSFRKKIFLTNDSTLVDIEEAIKYCRLLLDSIPLGGRSSSDITIFLAKLLKLVFDRTRNIEQLNESINLLAAVLRVPVGQAPGDSVADNLISSLFDRETFLLGTRDRHDPEAIQIMHQTIQTVVEVLYLAAENEFTSLPSRLHHSFALAKSLRYIKDIGSCSVTFVSTAYERAMSLMQDSVVLAPNLQLQHSQLVAMLRVVEKVPLDYASHLIDIHQHGQAIETLERGRALLWSELRGLRTSIQQIAGVDPLLAEKFTAINRDLEKLTMSVLPSGSSDVDAEGAEDCRWVDPYSRLLMKQRKLLEERDNIISQVRSLPGLQNFLMAPSFDVLRSAASHGPVIIINHSESRSDILILLHDAPPSLIPTSNGFYEDVNKLRDDLLSARKKQGLDSIEYDRTLASILEDLYNLVGRPVVDRLHKLNIPEQSRVWWCPTSVFCSLPLHAMGPIPSNDGKKRYFSDLYIPSYTPTLAALIDSHNPSPQLQSTKKPSLLLVAQPNKKTLPGVDKEIRVIQELNIKVESLIREDATTGTVLEGLRRHELVHFACHGNLEIGKPFDASFKLYRGQRLKLLDIVNSRLPHAEFAFLSACHTAELTEESIADEGLHLAAALQYCGFRSVVGTMWAMADTDGCYLAPRVYRSMLVGNDEGPCYMRSAVALRDAVRELRNVNGVGLERWVNFVHYGA